ncbi:monovalent cation/H+ antiporter complex subunit F [Paramicrobacterium sp. CJ85]|uniref:monovalent cation/H+ antiporter complex subunit F n=1 Tax=Paramicrobacterium sp. CJ85 TaxID=3445355 RepID=UPI003F6300E7
MIALNIVIGIAVVLFAVGALAALYRLITGPTLLDRVVASDVLLVTVMCGLGAEMAINHHATSMPLLLVLAAFAFIGSVSVAKFMGKKDDT